MHFWTDRAGKKLTFREFMDRWRQGIEGLTPLQIITTQYNSIKIILIGISLGLIFAVMSFKQLYWLFVILIGSLGVTLSQWVAIWQKKKMLERLKGGMKDSGV